MEYVDGLPIDEYARQHQLSIEDRLRLFVTVCAAVDYAHKNLVVHRDIKPGNILVTSEGSPKLLDFGVAKLLSSEPGSSPLTQTADRMMTPEYASPEQIRGDNITTSSDVYALGVLLYELLAGKQPFQLNLKSPLEAMQIVCERYPVAPSQAILANTKADGAHARRIVRSELDQIVLMAMRKEPSRRYASVSALSLDVQAYLHGYPVHARTDNFAYRSQKFVRRHKVATAATTVATLTLIAFSIGMGLLARRAERARAAADQQRRTALQEAEFLASVFQAATPDEERGHPITARNLLDQGAKRIDEELATEPEVQSTMLDNVGFAYFRLGDYDHAQSLLERAYKLEKSSTSPDRSTFAESAFNLATVYRMKGDFSHAEPLFREALSVRQRAPGPKAQALIDTLDGLGECLHDEGRDREAESILRSSLDLGRRQKIDNGDNARDYLALVLERRGAYPEARQLLREAVDISRRLRGVDSASYFFNLHNLAGASIDAGDLTEAETTEREALAVRRNILDRDHPDLAYPLNNLGWILLAKGNWQQAEPLLHEALEIRQKALGEKHPLYAASLANWARVLQARGDYAHAENSFHRALEIARNATGVDNWTVAKILSYLGLLELDRRDYAGAERFAREALDMRRKLGGDGNPDVATSLIEVGVDREFQHDPTSGEPLFRKALEIRKTLFHLGHPDTIEAEVRLGEALNEEGNFQEAEPLLREAVNAANHDSFRLLPWQIGDAKTQLGICLINLGRKKEGQALLKEGLSGLKQFPQLALRHRAIRQISPYITDASDPHSTGTN